MLQAESEKLRQAWIQAVQASIASAYKDIADNYYIEVRIHDYTTQQSHNDSQTELLFNTNCSPGSFRMSVSDLSPCVCSVWTGQPRPPPAVSTLLASPERGGRGLIRSSGEAWKASSRGYRACRAMSCAVTAAKQPRAGPPSTWECCFALNAQGSTGDLIRQYESVGLEAETSMKELFVSMKQHLIARCCKK